MTTIPPTTTATAQSAIDPEVLEALVGQIVTDAGAALVVPLGLLGDRLGLFSTLASRGPTTAEELAAETGLFERYLREWLLTMAPPGTSPMTAAVPTNQRARRAIDSLPSKPRS